MFVRSSELNVLEFLCAILATVQKMGARSIERQHINCVLDLIEQVTLILVLALGVPEVLLEVVVAFLVELGGMHIILLILIYL